jgi:8-oxo-dGTP diphosphatase
MSEPSEPIEVVAAIARRGGQILIAQRPEGDRLPGQWEFPGGKIEPGEKPRQALKRELREELGCSGIIGDVVHTLEHTYPDGRTVRVQFFHVEIEGDPQPLHHSELKWVKPVGMRLFPFVEADKPLIEKLARNEL